MADLGQRGIQGFVHYGPGAYEIFLSEKDTLKLDEGNSPTPFHGTNKPRTALKEITYRKAWFQSGPNGVQWYEWFLADSPIFNK